MEVHQLLISLSAHITFQSKYKPPNMKIEDYLQHYTTIPRDGLSKFGFALVSHLSELLNFKQVEKIISKYSSNIVTIINNILTD